MLYTWVGHGGAVGVDQLHASLVSFLISLGRPAFCGRSGGYWRRGSFRSLRVDMCASEYVRLWVSKIQCEFVICYMKESTIIHAQLISDQTNKKMLYIHGVRPPVGGRLHHAPLVNVFFSSRTPRK